MKNIITIVGVIFLISVSGNTLANGVFAKYCGADAHRLCFNVKDKRRIYACLVHKGSQLSPSCRVALDVATKLFIKHAAQVCKIDVRHLCRNVHAGQGRILRCLKRNYNQLNRPCAAVVAKVSGVPYHPGHRYSGD